MAEAVDWLRQALGPRGHGAADLWALHRHFLALALLGVGGALATAADMQRFLVHERGWLQPAQFTEAIALAQAAPGPNVLFVALLGWHAAGLAGAAASLAGILLPTGALALLAGRHGRRHRHSLGVRAFTHGLAPLAVGLTAATGWLLADPWWQPLRQALGAAWAGGDAAVPARALVGLGLAAACALALRRGWVSPLGCVAAGAVVGAAGWV